jgi:hypothetical protein
MFMPAKKVDAKTTPNRRAAKSHVERVIRFKA